MSLQPARQSDSLPAFILSAFNDNEDGDVTLQVHLPEDPSIRRHASMGLLYGLALLVLDKEGTVASAIDRLLEDGPINEIDATNRITLLLQEDGNVLRS